MSRRNPAKRWSLLCAAGLAVAGGSALGQDRQEQTDKARTVYEAIENRIGSRQAVEQNLTSPLISGMSFTTLDGQTNFQKQLSCPSSASYLEIFFGLGAGGDLSPVYLKQDTDFDGSFDVNAALPVPVSGVCANGVIGCAPGTWTECTPYLWHANDQGRITLQPSGLAALAGCYCVNNSCGSGLGFANRDTILDDLAGGMAGALMRQDPRYAVSAVQKQDFLIRLSGQDTRACAAEPDTPQHAYYDDASTLSSDAFAAASGDRVHGLIAGVPSGEETLLTHKSCRVERQVTLEEILGIDIISRVTSTHPYDEQGCAGDPDCFLFAIGDGENNGLRARDAAVREEGCGYFHEEIVWSIDHVDRITDATLLDAVYEDQIAVRVNDILIFSTGGYDGVNRPSDCQVNDQKTVSINRSFKDALQDGTNRLIFSIAVKDKGSGQLRARVRYEPSCALEETIDDTCAPHAESDQCRLVDEIVDSVPTFRNGGRTGLTPLAGSRTLHGAKCSRSFTRPWFDRARTYECETDGPGRRAFDFSRPAHILGNSTVDDYADRLPAGGDQFRSLTGPYSARFDMGIPDCEQICKTSFQTEDTDVSNTGVVNTLLNEARTIQYQYHQCAAGVCPVGPGEEIVEDCGCLSDFNDALLLMQTFRLAGQDLICTSGVKKPLQ
ncbi:hypothetical protein [Eilatimonas milleporae]|uniref:Conjugal transfer mating pair stabilization protein TraN n=1 Tax=Eilatimonas milleporae TaxID=911205 RepID=A0A3M0CDH7_9PROT|nr:hypothetical protein [Eilatimonas milleporae]RMB05049.1 hypothetical protein BXY39_2628 [Eilatimonas milleporae]